MTQERTASPGSDGAQDSIRDALTSRKKVLLYEHRKLIADENFEGLADLLIRESRATSLSGSVMAVAFIGISAYRFIRYGQTGSGEELAFALFWIVLVIAMFWIARRSRRTIAICRDVKEEMNRAEEAP